MGARVTSVATIRDYWPLCPVSTRLFAGGEGETFECDDCHRIKSYIKCCRSASAKWYPGGLTMPFLNTARWLQTLAKSRALSRSDAVVAVSEYVRGELSRSGRIPEAKVVTIPNLVDLPSVDLALAGPWPLHDISPSAPFLLFAGKLDTNKGVRLLPRAIKDSVVGLPLVVAGDGPLRGWLEEEARAANLDFRFYAWVDNDAVLRLMHRARVLVFPSAWQEPLSRVLLEGCAAGASIVAIDTGGTSDIVVDGESGWLAQDSERFSEGIRCLSTDDALNGRLRAGARKRAEDIFAAPIVSARIEDLYRSLLEVVEAA
jgi:glycosyltransferase involved in cell wall biosynthesis